MLRGTFVSCPTRLLAIALALLSAVQVNADAHGLQWTWLKGATIVNQPGTYGVQGVSSTSGTPGARNCAATWVDSAGNFWLYGNTGFDANGDQGAMADLWKFEGGTKRWTWVKGTSTINTNPSYGTRGTPNPTNTPGSRYSSYSWRDNSGNLWLFGGRYDGTGSTGWFNDLWRYEPSSGNWTWMTGSIAKNQAGTYGTLGVADPLSTPGARNGGASWSDANGNFWLFGGYGRDSVGSEGWMNDLWKYEPSTGNWTWMKGSDRRNQAGVYGTLQVSDPANTPSTRRAPIFWTTKNALWLFGGYGVSASGNGALNDLWKFDLSSGNWTWMNGTSTRNLPPVYGTIGVPAVPNGPGGRSGAVTWTDSSGALWLFGGTNYDGVEAGDYFSDLWNCDPSTAKWTWMGGPNAGNQSGTYGTLGVSAVVNWPGSRSGAAAWTDGAGRFWLFGGAGYDSGNNDGYLNDVWSLDGVQIHGMTVDLPGEVPLVMLEIPPGSFTMGAIEAGSEANEQPVHPVNLSSGFYLGKYEVTQAQWQAVMNINPASGYGAGSDYPVYNVTWEEITGLNGLLEKLNALGQGLFRLPTEAEWEYACRAGSVGRWSFGDNSANLTDYAWFASNAGDVAHPVGEKLPNAWGLHDMHGNVWEWCQDWFHDSYVGAPSDGSAWEVPVGAYRVLRGGFWGNAPSSTRSANRGNDNPTMRYRFGLRLVRALDSPAPTPTATFTPTATPTPTPQTGALNVELEPDSARSAGAQWRRLGTSTWRYSSETEFAVPVGHHAVTFKNLSGWTRPGDRDVEITEGMTTVLTATYLPNTPTPTPTPSGYIHVHGAIEGGNTHPEPGSYVELIVTVTSPQPRQFDGLNFIFGRVGGGDLGQSISSMFLNRTRVTGIPPAVLNDGITDVRVFKSGANYVLSLAPSVAQTLSTAPVTMKVRLTIAAGVSFPFSIDITNHQIGLEAVS